MHVILCAIIGVFFATASTAQSIQPILDPVPAAMFSPVVAEYKKVDGLELEHHVIFGDHSFSWSRLAVTQLIVNWAHRDCR